METHEWAEKLIVDVQEKMKQVQEDYGQGEFLFRVFCSPVSYSPDIMIVGFNTSREGQEDNEKYGINIPYAHEYFLYDSKIARKMKYLFEGIERYDWLENSVKLNLFFYGTESEKLWDSLPGRIRNDMESFCFRKINEIIDNLKPRHIVTEGLNTFHTLLNSVLLGCELPVEKTGLMGRKLYARSKYFNIPIIGLPNFAKDTVSFPEWNEIKAYLKSDIKDIPCPSYLH